MKNLWGTGWSWSRDTNYITAQSLLLVAYTQKENERYLRRSTLKLAVDWLYWCEIKANFAARVFKSWVVYDFELFLRDKTGKVSTHDAPCECNKFPGIWYLRWSFAIPRWTSKRNLISLNWNFSFSLKADLKEEIFLKCESFYFWNGVIIAKFILSLFFVSWTELYTCTHITFLKLLLLLFLIPRSWLEMPDAQLKENSDQK